MIVIIEMLVIGFFVIKVFPPSFIALLFIGSLVIVKIEKEREKLRKKNKLIKF